MRSRLALLTVLLFAVAAASASASGSVGYYGCRSHTPHPAALVKPRSIIVACADGNFYLTGIHWATWNAAAAKGTATAHANDCKPACYAGHFHTYPATVTLSAPRACKGKRVFTKVSYVVPRLDDMHTSTTFLCN